MSENRRIYTRRTTTQRFVVSPFALGTGSTSASRFRVEIIKSDGLDRSIVYSRELPGSIEVEETIEGNLRLVAGIVADAEASNPVSEDY